jgi:hypothetical protein
MEWQFYLFHLHEFPIRRVNIKKKEAYESISTSLTVLLRLSLNEGNKTEKSGEA